jgi:hypothetical protein
LTNRLVNGIIKLKEIETMADMKEAGRKAWVTRRENAQTRSDAARKAWATRYKNEIQKLKKELGY